MKKATRILTIAGVTPVLVWVFVEMFSAELLGEFRGQAARALLVYLLAVGLAIWAARNGRVRQTVYDFFHSKDRPLNLAIARIVIFSFIFEKGRSWKGKLEMALAMPDDLVIPVQVWGDLLLALWPSADVLRVMHTVMVVASFLAMVGLFSRSAAWTVVITGFFVMGTPQFFGKVNHHHHLLWFSALLAASPCGGALSLDAALKAWRKGAACITEPRSSRAAALALRFAWLQMGVLYFFPGFWKFVQGGTAWFLSDNLKFRMYSIWLQKDYIPSFRIDLHPVLYKSAALATILFELLFVVLIFFPLGRIVAGAGGLLFHSSTKYFMKIGFKSLTVCYVLLFDWRSILRRLGIALFPKELEVVFHGGAASHGRWVALAHQFDVLERVRFRLPETETTFTKTGWSEVLEIRLDQAPLEGRQGLWALVLRLPLLWPLLPLVMLTRSVKSSSTRAAPRDPANRGLVPVVITGAVLLTFNLLFGLTFRVSSWPFANYPSFTGVYTQSTRSTVSLQGLNQEKGETATYSLRSLDKAGGNVRIARLSGRIVSSKSDRALRERLARGAWKLLVDENPALADATRIRVFLDRLSSIPEDWESNPVKRKLLFEIPVQRK